jgi:hypothetical protein
MARYSFGSIDMLFWCCMKLSRRSAARFASSWVGEVGVEPIVADTVPEAVDRPARLLLLLA